MTDISSLIERGAQALHRRNGFVPWEKVTEPAREEYRKDVLAILEESGALSRLTVSPPPADIAGYVTWLKGLADKGGKGGVDIPNVDARALGRIAAALRAQAQEVERLKLDNADLKSQLNPRKCAATISTDPPQDCGWPECGCDPETNKVLARLEECGYLSPDEGYAKDRRIAELEAERDTPIYLQAPDGWYAISVGRTKYCFFGATIDEAKAKEAQAIEAIRALSQEAGE